MSLADAEIDGPMQAKADTRRERIILGMLAAVQFTTIVDFMIVMPLGPQLMRTLAISPQQFGLVVSSYTLSAGFTGLVASSLIDRFDRRTAFLNLFVGFLVGTLFCGLAPNYPLLLAARIVTGAFGGVLGGMALAIVGDVFPEERRGRATGALMSAFALASVLGVPLGLSLGTAYGWHVPFLALVAVGVVVLPVGMRALPPLRGHLNSGSPRRSALATMAETYTHPNHLRAFALTTSMMIGSFAVIPFVSASLVANVGVPEGRLPWVFVAGGALTLFGAPLIGRLADRFGKLPVYLAVAPITAVLMLVVTSLPPWSGLAGGIASVGVFMLANSGRMVSAMAMITGSVEPRLRGGFMSANSAVQHIAAGVGSMVSGLIVVKSADGRLLHYPWVGVIGVVATLASMVLATRLQRFPDPVPGGKTGEPDCLTDALEAVPAIEPA